VAASDRLIVCVYCCCALWFQTVYPVFMLDPHFANPEHVGAVRYHFLLECLTDLDKQVRMCSACVL
jgi:hypothetical protein